ncbi:MAG: cytochrome P450 [Opitutales bacterium]|nr:cytochrome P450 [Opitutales bacterium]
MDAFPKFEPYEPAFLEDPYPTFMRLRAERPVFYDEDWRLTFFTRHKDIKSIFMDRQQFGRDYRHRLKDNQVDSTLVERIFPINAPNWVKFVREAFMDQEPTVHTRLRGLVSKAFTRRESHSYGPGLLSLANSILDQKLDGESFDAIKNFASPIPVSLIADLMGIEEDVHARLTEWSSLIVVPYDLSASADDLAKAEKATIDFAEFLRGLIEKRRRDPGSDLISSMLVVEEAGDTLTEDEIISTAILTLNAGHEATVQAIGNALLALAKHPDQYRYLTGNVEGISTAVEELLRYDTPLQMFDRWILEDCEIGGCLLKQGQKVGLLVGSANHDEAAFVGDTESLDLTRDSSSHIAFGAGLHHCIGSHLARIELVAAITALVSKVQTLEIADSLPQRKPSLVFRGLSSLPLSLTPR